MIEVEASHIEMTASSKTNELAIFRKNSYSQCGEDLIIEFILNVLRVDHPNYIDIGAYHPYRFSNTFLFYEKGASGICVEADPTLATNFANARPSDVVLNAAISGSWSGTSEFYLMSEASLNTLIREEADRLVRDEGCQIQSAIPIEVISITDLLRRYCSDKPLDLLSIDVEGADDEIIRNIDYSNIRPKVVCIETLTYSRTGLQQKNSSLIDRLKDEGYMLYADTYINSIFVDSKLWHNRS
ncbi:FkbM family methyltransferase [Salinarimonas soli]|uniref:FkbM family methyltransferase n=1 Tax=Salinarimonas soli TaxID=1638099 RepID=A0A5B2V873_9HYPH|nr:FkbM family methyltransferase [Salinarimonas soli]KAA2235244.1 FkbM family methyltransferase [Salinarimonas soli]